jgi:hypothetical protein
LSYSFVGAGFVVKVYVLICQGRVCTTVPKRGEATASHNSAQKTPRAGGVETTVKKTILKKMYSKK